MDQTDEQLVDLAKSGDDRAFDILMRRYLKAIFRFAQQYVRGSEDAEDVTQETFFKAWKYLKRFTPGSTFKPWLFTIARNTALDVIKKKKLVIFSTLDNEEQDITFAETVEDVTPLAPELFEQAETALALSKLMEVLHPDHRSVLLLHYRDEMTFEEIAIIMDKPMNTVKSWHRRALERIRLNYAPK